MDRIKRGYILINGKKQFIYDGLNIIGRNKGAAIIIPDTSVSHYHSSVVVIENRHYISDINSSNGTSLEEHTLTPLKLYELNHENVLKFGLINAKYFKFVSSNTQDVLENCESNSLRYEEQIFAAGTQIYDIPKTYSQNLKKPTIHLRELSELTNGNKSDSQNSVALSINDMPTQVMENHSDEELTIDDAKEKNNSCNDENNDAIEYVSINDLPTQIVVREVDDMSLLERADPYDTISDIIDETVVENNDNVNDENSNESTDFLTMQPATQRFGSDAESQLFVHQLQRRVRNIISSSEDDLSTSDSQKNVSNKVTIENSTSSGEETDIESAQIRKKELRKKNKAIITSDSDGDSTDAEGANVVLNPKAIPQTEDDKNNSAQIRKKKLRKENKTIITSDSDGDSTDAEGANILSNAKEIPQIEDGKNDDTDTDVETSCVSKMTDEKINLKSTLDDSDIIATTQQDVPSVTVNAAKEKIETAIKSQSNDNGIKDVLMIDNQETSLTDSFHLMLTNTEEHLEDGTDINKISTEEKQSTNNEERRPQPSLTTFNINEEALPSNSPINEIPKGTEILEEPQTQMEISFDDNLQQSETRKDKEVDEEPQTQLEVSFDDNLEQSEIDTGRPQNPLISVLKDSGSSELDDSIEDKLAKMFQTQTSAGVSPKQSEDEIFAQPTQVVNPNDLNPIKEQDVFLIPTQRIVPKRNTTKSNETFKSTNEEDDDLFFKPTQIISNIAAPPQNTTEHKESDEDIFLKPTQIIDDDIIINVPTLKEHTKVDAMENDLFLQPTQIVTNISEITEDVTSDGTKSASTSAVSNKRKATVMKSKENFEDDIFLLPTQIIDLKSEGSSKNMANINPTETNINVSKHILEETKNCDENIELQTKKDSSLTIKQEETWNNTINVENICRAEKQEFPTDIIGGDIHDISAKKKDHKEEESTMELDNNNTGENILASATFIDVKNDELVSEKTNSKVVMATEMSESTSKRKTKKQLVANPENKRTKRQKVENDDKNEASTSKIKETPVAPSVTESRTLRRSRRKHSNDEKFEHVESNLQMDKLPVVQETRLPPDPQISPIDNESEINSHASANSEDEFVGVEQQTPFRTRQPGKQTSVKNKKTKQTNSTNDQLIGTSSRLKRKSPEIEVSSSKIVSEDQISASNVHSAPTPTKKRKVPQRVTKTRKLNIAEKESESENIEVKQEPTSNLKKESNVNSILSEPSTSTIHSETIENKVRISLRRKNKGIEHAPEENSSNTNSHNLDLHEENTKENNNDKELSGDSINTFTKTRKSKKVIQENSETSESTTELVNTPSNTSSTKTRKYSAVKRQNSTTSNASTLTVDSINSQTRKSRRRKSITDSEDDFELSNVKKEETISKVTPTTPTRNKRILKPKVVFTMLESPELETIIRTLGGFVVDSIETSTVLLTTHVKRSQKLLSAVGLSKPICSPKWLHDSKKSNKFLDPWDYILEDEEAEAKWNFSLRESLRRSGNTKLLKDYTFLIMTNTAQDVLRGSIDSCGGKCANRAPSKDQQTNFVIVASPDNKSKYSKYLKQKPPPTIIAPEAVFDGVLRQELRFENHLLT